MTNNTKTTPWPGQISQFQSTHMKIENQNNNLLGDSLMTNFGNETSGELGRLDPLDQIMDQQMSLEKELKDQENK